MDLGAFSISLNVKDIDASRDFYAKLGFTPFVGDEAQGWLIMKNGDHVVGLFQGVLERNTLTFNPGWDSDARPLPAFTDIRDLQRELAAQGVEILQGIDEDTTGPGSIVISDPDGNPILLDQHV